MRTRRSPRRSRLAVGIATGLATVAVAAVAQAQNTDPYATGEQAGKDNNLDTDITPQAKESDHWELVHGAKFPKTEPVEGSATTFDTDLFALSFENPKLGLAGGSACPREPERMPEEEDSEFGQRVTACAEPDETKHRRVPTLYRYVEPDDADASWDPISLPGATEPGYIGGVAWIDNARGEDTKALVVGGTGTYPRRDLGATDQDSFGRSNAIEDPTDLAKADEAGEPRAWIYDATTDSATELDLSDFAADESDRAGMRGFTAVDCYEDPRPGYVGEPGSGGEPDPDEPQLELCFAGALGQVWQFLGDEFTGERIDAQSPAGELTRASLFRYRVRDIAFDPFRQQPQATAVTAGCCAADELNHKASVLSYDSESTPPWSATERSYSASAPESLYSITASRQYIASPGGPEKPGEPSSAGTGGLYGLSNFESLTSGLSTARFVSGEGSPNNQFSSGWAVGELRSSRRTGLGARGLGVAFPGKEFGGRAITPMVNGGVSCSSFNPPTCGVRPTAEEIADGWEPIDQQKLDTYIRSRHYFLPSYSANAIDMLGATSQSDGWAVGDHGAILRLSASGRLAAGGAGEPKPPRLGAAREQSFAETDAYAPPPLPARAGAVPPLGPESVELREPRMNPAGAVTPAGAEIEQIVMSRDGSEGIAWGSAGDTNALFHFDGTRWSRCRPTGIEGFRPPDPACAAMAPLEGYKSASGSNTTLEFIDAVRVPLENDDDPTNDDDFEVVTLTNEYRGSEAGGSSGIHMFARFRNGRWLLDSRDEGQELISRPWSVAFTAPDDGWILGRDGINGGQERLYHFNGERWYDCRETPVDCGDIDGRLPVPPTDTSSDDLNGLASVGDRVYLYGGRAVGAVQGNRRLSPLILYRDLGGTWTDGSRPGEDGEGLDPAFSDPGTGQVGRVVSLSMSRSPEGGYEGWAFGAFGAGAGAPIDLNHTARIPADSVLLRLDPDDGGWRTFRSAGAFEDYMIPPLTGSTWGTKATNSRLQVGYPSAIDPDGAFIADQSSTTNLYGGRIFGFNAARQRFDLLESGRPEAVGASLDYLGEARPAGKLSAMAPDGRGGFWAAVDGYFFHYSDRAREEPFKEVANPLGIRDLVLGDIDAGPDGSVWAASETNQVFRYDRRLGWQEGRVPGWDPGRVVTRASRAEAIAVGPGGEGLLVGEGGRIAQLSPEGVSLDPAAGRSCGLGDPIPCGTSRDLSAVDIAPDGSALATGERLTVLWRPSGGDFRTVSGPSLPSTTRILAISYPTPTSAYLLTSNSTVYRGTLSGADWRWELDAKAVEGTELPVLDANERAIPLHDLAIEPSGHGYAVGDDGLVLERSSEGTWRRIEVPALDDLTSLAFAHPADEGALIGGESGVILTGQGADFELARVGAFPETTGQVVGFAQLPGSSEGSVDAWAALAPAPGGRGDSRLLRYLSDPDDQAVEPASGLAALADAPARSEGELSLAAFGKSDCDRSEEALCPELSATTTTNEIVARQIVDDVGELSERGEVDLAVLSGDAVDSTGLHGSSLGDYDRIGKATFGTPTHTQLAGQLKHRRFAEALTDPLEQEGVPIFGAPGGQDLSEAFACDDSRCHSSKGLTTGGENYGWREAFAGRAEPWGDGEGALEIDAGIEIEPAPGSEGNSVRVEDQQADADGEGAAPKAKTEIGGASTHYAVDAVKDGEAIARIVFVDTSMRSLAASDPLQQPHDLGGGQQRFLERMICKEGQSSTFGDRCTREKGQKAIVVSNTPTYSYGPGALTHTSTDATTFEATMLRYDVDLVISGALGYSGLYYTLAPGLHEPCPGGAHPEAPPTGKTPDCFSGPAGPVEQATKGTAADIDPTSLISGQGLSGAYPTLIAAGAGGKFGPDGNETPDGPAGQWHGYSITRLLPNGDLVVEQRPILDWIDLEASRRMIRPRQKLLLNGYGRSLISTTTEQGRNVAFHYEISSAAITHRYDLLRADPEKPWLPLEDAEAGAEADGSESCEGYLCLPSEVATIDSQSGQVKSGSGKHPPTYAIAMLSVGEKVATVPLYFEPSPSFRFTAPTAPRPTPAVAAVAAPGSPTTPTTPSIPNVSVPTPPVPPALVPPPPAPPAAPPQPPVPPPVPPASAGPSALSLSFAPTGLVVAPTASVIPPPAPPINPAPPGGARKEARQRQAATQKSGADNAEGDSSAQDGGGDLAQDGPDRMVRRDRVKPGQSFTPLARESQPSAWATGALYGGGITIMAFALAAGWTRGRPTPRRGRPDVPAPAFSEIRRRR